MAVGGKKPVPMTAAAGSAFPEVVSAQLPEAPLVALISVVDRLPAAVRNSCTRPFTRTASPTVGLLALPTKTYIPSEVRALPSSASCIQKPMLSKAVTMPAMLLTELLTKGEVCELPCRSPMLCACAVTAAPANAAPTRKTTGAVAGRRIVMAHSFGGATGLDCERLPLPTATAPATHANALVPSPYATATGASYPKRYSGGESPSTPWSRGSDDVHQPPRRSHPA